MTDFEVPRGRLRELERIIRARRNAGEAISPDQYLAPAARALANLQRRNGRSDDLADRLEVWARGYFVSLQLEMVRRVAQQVMARPFLDKADELGRELALSLAERQRLRVRTIGACDADKEKRAMLAKQRRRKRERDRIAAKRRAAGIVPRAEFLARALTRARPWIAAGISRATWYRQRETGVLQSPETGVLQSPETGVSPHKPIISEQPTRLARLAPGGRRSARAPHSAVAGGPPAEPCQDSANFVIAGQRAPDHPDDGGRQMLLLQQWGAQPQEARACFDRWHGKVPSATMAAAFEGAAKRGCSNRDRRRWLSEQMERALRDPHYRVPCRAPHATDGKAFADIERVFRSARACVMTVDDVVAGLPGKTRATIIGVLSKMFRAGRLDRVRGGRGRYALPAAAEGADR